jgi:hypothetical protein
VRRLQHSFALQQSCQTEQAGTGSGTAEEIAALKPVVLKHY